MANTIKNRRAAKYKPTALQKKAAVLFAEALEGDTRARVAVKEIFRDGETSLLSEAVSSSDLMKSFILGVNIKVEDLYHEAESTWTDFAARLSVPDFKPQFLRELVFDTQINDPAAGGDTVAPFSLPNVPELSEYPSFGWQTSAKAFTTAKKGARLPFSWEALIDDNWSLFSSIPQRLMTFAKDTEDSEAYKQLVSATGPNPNTFSAANNNLVSGNSDSTTLAGSIFNQNFALTPDALALAKRELNNRLYKGYPMAISKFRLVVPRVMGDYARKVLSMQSGLALDAANRTRLNFDIDNSDVQLTVSDWFQRLDKSGNVATTWYLLPDGGHDGYRTTMGNVFLEGHEIPDLRQSGNTGVELGGGDVPSSEGSLLNDDIEFRIRHVVAGTVLNPWGFLASNGTAAGHPNPAYGI